MKTTLPKIALVSLAAIEAYFHQLRPLTVLLVCVMLMDYVSGMARAWYKHELSSKIGLHGIVKKLCYLFAVAVAVTTDMVLQIAAESAKIDLGGCYFCTLLVMVWLTLNECISILENISDIGVPVPGFLLAVVKRLKQNAEKTGGDSNGKR